MFPHVFFLHIIMPELQELVAAQQGRVKNHKSSYDGALNKFRQPDQWFTGSVKTTTAIVEGEEALYSKPQEYKGLITTVTAELKQVYNTFTRAFDGVASIDATNCKAKADLEVNGVVIAKDVPAVTLLQGEKSITQLIELVSAAPILPTGKTWIPAADQGDNIFTTQYPVTTQSVHKTKKWTEVTPATQYHPAQIKEVEETTPKATIVEISYSGCPDKATKDAWLERLGALKEAFQTARARANRQEATLVKLGAVVTNFVLTGNLTPVPNQ
jgi:hypothetical protein